MSILEGLNITINKINILDIMTSVSISNKEIHILFKKNMDFLHKK